MEAVSFVAGFVFVGGSAPFGSLGGGKEGC